MIVDTNAYVLSLIKVLLCCLIRDFAVPLLVWRKHLRKKGYGYRFWFCVLTQASLQINLVLLLGFFNISNRYTVIGSNVVIYALIVWNYSDKKFFLRCNRFFRDLWEVYKEEKLSRYMLQGMKDGLRNCWKMLCQLPLWGYLKRNWVEASLLAALVIYNIWFLTHNVMLYHCYQFSDIPVHQSWIYDLEHGTLFSDGIYPFGMHVMVYIIRIIFRLNLREILLYAGAYQTVLLMIALFLLAKEIFHAKYTPVTVVMIISFMLNQSRFAASLPQEAGMYTVVGLAYFMLRYLHGDRRKFVIEQDSAFRRFFRINAYINRRYINSEAIMLMLCVALVIAYHFYTAIAAIFLVIAIGLAYLPRILKRQYFIPILFCGIMGAVIAVLPMAACLAKGIPFQESMAWATSVINNEEWKGSDTYYQDMLAEKQGKGGQATDSTDPGSANTDSSNTNSLNPDTSDLDMQGKGGTGKGTAVDYSTMTPGEILKYVYGAMFSFGVMVMFGGSATLVMFYCMLLGLICAVVMLLWKKNRNYGHDYIALILNMTILCIIGAAQALGIIELIASARASTFAEPFVGLIYMLPVDFAFRILGGWKSRHYQTLLRLLSLGVCGLAAVLIVELGWYHAYFDVNQAYYNESEYLTRHIKKAYPKLSYTVVSPTEELYDILDYGRKHELSQFIDMVDGNQGAFTFPTKYVFFFIEKRVLQDYTYGSVEVGLKYAAMDLIYLESSQDYFYQRAVIESKAYYWAQKMLQVYPRNFKVYYEDDIYVAYILEQNTYNPYNLQIDYLSGYEDEIKANGWDAGGNMK
ncbi:MAG TPA: hypothetical protein GXX75_17465 [Clostridiales bacterium]|nr:hypothetical protein [Clostridiales bacterium]